MYLHTATLLPNGKVLVAGGFNSTDFLTSAELYDPATGFWTVTGSLHDQARATHTATLLPNGKVLVAGGLSAGLSGTIYLDTAEIYDPPTALWTRTDNLGTKRGSHTATLLPSGKVLVAGGQTTGAVYSSSAESVPIPAHLGRGVATGSLGTARHGHTATLLPSRQGASGGRTGQWRCYLEKRGTVQSGDESVDGDRQPGHRNALTYGDAATLRQDAGGGRGE